MSVTGSARFSELAFPQEMRPPRRGGLIGILSGGPLAQW
jgi:hypothetical protein